MLNKILVTLTTAGMLTLSAAGLTYRISLLDDSVVAGKQLKAGDYKVELTDNNTAVLVHGKKSIDVPAKAETSPTRFSQTEIQYSTANNLQDIRVGGTNTKIVFGGATTTANGVE
jgi:hypothetical protein